jgi:hypothetical protein
MGDGCVQDLLNAVHVRCEAGHDDRWRLPREHALEGGPMSRSGVVKPGTSAFVESINEQVDALFPEAGEGAQVSDSAVMAMIHLKSRCA